MASAATVEVTVQSPTAAPVNVELAIEQFEFEAL
jgi:hypothetical protein